MSKKQLHLIFDFGNVLIGVDESRTYQAFAALGCRPELQDNTALFHQLDKGEIDQAGFLEAIKAYVPTRTMRRDILSAWNALLLEIPESSFQLLRKLRPHFPMALLSNTSVPHINEIQRAAGQYNWKSFCSHFQAMHYSFDLGFRKPEPEIFKKVEQLHGWKSESCILIDDRNENLEAAESLGWKGIPFALDRGDTHEELRQSLLALL